MKSESKLLRDTIFVLWNKKAIGGDPEMYYKKVMAVLRGIVQKKIDFDDDFMKEQEELAKNYN